MDSNLRDKRAPTPSIKHLSNIADETESAISDILAINIEQCSDDSEYLIDLVSQCKALFKTYSEAVFKLIEMGCKAGALNRANEIR